MIVKRYWSAHVNTRYINWWIIIIIIIIIIIMSVIPYLLLNTRIEFVYMYF